MKRLLIALLSAVALFAGQVWAEESGDTSVEQQMISDLAARLAQQLHRTAALAEKVHQAADTKERSKALADYKRAMQTAMRIEGVMDALSGDGAAARGGMGGKMKGGMSCMCMKGMKGMKGMGGKKGKAKPEQGSALEEEDNDDEEASPSGAADDPHAGHR